MDYIAEQYKKLSQDMVKKKGTQVRNVRVNAEDEVRLEKHCGDHNIKISAFVRLAITNEIDRWNETE